MVRRGYRQLFVVCQPRTDDSEVVKVDDELKAMMRGRVAEVDPFLVSRNTLGNRKTANSKSQRQMSNGGSGKRWWFALGNAEVK